MNIKNIFLVQRTLCIVCVTLLFTSCAAVSKANKKEDITEPDMNKEESPQEQNPLADVNTDVLLNMTKEQAIEFAKKNAVDFRVIEEDGQAYPATRDFRPGRINATLKDGKIIKYFIEGKETLPRSIQKPLLSDKREVFIGMTEKEAYAYAKKENSLFRVVKREGESLPVTMDYRVGRINAVVLHGIVMEYTVE